MAGVTVVITIQLFKVAIYIERERFIGCKRFIASETENFMTCRVVGVGNDVVRCGVDH